MPLRLEHSTVAERVEVGCLLLVGAGQYGLVTQLARELGTSRRFLYRWRDRVRTTLEQALAPHPAGRPPLDRQVPLDRAVVERSVVVLSQVAHASVRGIQECLVEILGVERSLRWIEGVLQEAARRARALPPGRARPVAVAADEIFAGDQPVVEVVEPHSGLVLVLEPVESRDETTWGCTWLDLTERGVEVTSLVTDGAEGLRAGACAAGLPAPDLDHWHTLRDVRRIERRLEATPPVPHSAEGFPGGSRPRGCPGPKGYPPPP